MLIEVHSLLDSLGLSYIWCNQVQSIESFKRILRQRLRDQFIQEWQSRVAENSFYINYGLLEKGKKTKVLWGVFNLSPIYHKVKSTEI